MPHRDRQIQTGTSTMRAMTQEINAGRMMSFVSNQHETERHERGAIYTEEVLSRGLGFP